MKRNQLNTLNKMLAPSDIAGYPDQLIYPYFPVIKGSSLPPDAEEFDSMLFRNYGEPEALELFEVRLKALGFIQNKYPNWPNLKPIAEVVVATKPEEIGKFLFKHVDMKLIYVVDQNGPNKGLVGKDEVIDQNDFYPIPSRNHRRIS